MFTKTKKTFLFYILIITFSQAIFTTNNEHEVSVSQENTTLTFENEQQKISGKIVWLYLQQEIEKNKLNITIGSPLFLYLVSFILRHTIRIHGGLPKEGHKLMLERTKEDALNEQNKALDYKKNLESNNNGHAKDMLLNSFSSYYYCISDNDLHVPIYTNGAEGANKDVSTDFLTVHGFGCHPFNNLIEFDPSFRHWIAWFKEAEDNLLLNTSFGGARDVEVVLITLVTIIRQNPNATEIIISAHSRGCDPVIKALAELNKGGNSSVINKLNITKEECNIILRRIESGYLRLKCPMKNKTHIFKSKAGWLLGNALDKVILPFTTNLRCKPFDRPAIDYIPDLQGLNIKTLVIFAKKDSVVTNDLDTTYINRLREALNTNNDSKNKDTIKSNENIFSYTYNGDHNHVLSHAELNAVVDTFHTQRSLDTLCIANN